MTDAENNVPNNSADRSGLAQDVLKRVGASAGEIEDVSKLDGQDSEAQKIYGKAMGVMTKVVMAPWTCTDADFDVSIPSPVPRIRHAQVRCLAILQKHLKAGTLLEPSKFTAEVHAELAEVRTDDERNAVLQKHCKSSTLMDIYSGKISREVIRELGTDGCYFGMRIGYEFGGILSPMTSYMPFLTEMAAMHGELAALGSVNNCIGLSNSLSKFGTREQRERFLVPIAHGLRTACFGATEPGAGIALTDITTEFTRDPNSPEWILINGSKRFTTGLVYGCLMIVLGKFEGRFYKAIVQIPDSDTDTFRLERYGLYALKTIHNHGSRFINFRIPYSNLVPIEERMDGIGQALTVLNDGRNAVAALAAGNVLSLTRHVLGWTGYRWTLKAPLDKRMFAQCSLGEMAGFFYLCRYQSNWCAKAIDAGLRAEDQCIIAKNAAAEGLNEVLKLATDLEGARSFREGDLVGDSRQKIVAARTYEGPENILNLKLIDTITKKLSDRFLLPLGAGMAKLSNNWKGAFLASGGLALILGRFYFVSGGAFAAATAASVGALFAWGQASSNGNGFQHYLRAFAVTLLSAAGCGVLMLNAGPLLATILTPHMLAMATAALVAAGTIVAPVLAKGFKNKDLEMTRKNQLLKNLSERMVRKYSMKAELTRALIFELSNPATSVEDVRTRPYLLRNYPGLTPEVLDFLSLEVGVINDEDKLAAERLRRYLTGPFGLTADQSIDLISKVLSATLREREEIARRLSMERRLSADLSGDLVATIGNTASCLKGDHGKRLKHTHGLVDVVAEFATIGESQTLWNMVRNSLRAIACGVTIGTLTWVVAGILGVSHLTSLFLTALCGGVLGLVVSGNKKLIDTGLAFSLWFANMLVPRFSITLEGVHDSVLLKHCWFAQWMLYRLPIEMVVTMVKHQERLALMHLQVMKLAKRYQYAVSIRVAAPAAARSGSEFEMAAVDVCCQKLAMRLTGEQEGDDYFADCAEVGKMIIAGKFQELEGLPRPEIVDKY